MATVTPTFNALVSAGDGSVVTFTWVLTSTDADGAAFSYAEWADVTFIARGTWGGATLKVQGSADGTNFVTAAGLNSAAGGTEFTATTDKIAVILERPLYVRPILTTVGAGASVTVTAVCRRANPLRT